MTCRCGFRGCPGSREHAERKARKIMAKVAARHDQERYTVPTQPDGTACAG